MKNILKLALFLAIVSGVAGVLLAYANSITAPIIAYNNAQKEAASFAAIFGDGVGYEEIDVAGYSSIVKAYKAGDAGYAYKLSVTGRNGAIVYICGVDNSGKIIGYSVIEQGETAGLGDKICTDDFVNSIVGNNLGDKLDTISGSTISSSAVIGGFDEVAAHFNTVK